MSIGMMPSSWPPVIIGVILGVYWLRVLQMVMRTRRTVGRAANLVPPERLGRALRIIWAPVIILWIFLPLGLPFVVGLPAWLAPVRFPGSAVVGWVAVGVAAVAFALTWICWINMGTSWRMGIDPNEKTRLVFTGPYAYVRHPIYGLSQVLMVAAVCALPSPMMLLLAALHVALMQWEVRREERFLVALHGPGYAEYMQRVGRFLPRITRWK
jgi:protein-S-isoprenylcysteine O-methyltransferase Ste14